MPSALNPNLSEPQPVSVTYTSTTSSGSVTSVNPTAPMHTNMAWYTLLPNITAPSPLTLVGKYLFFGDGNGNVLPLRRLPAGLRPGRRQPG